MKKQSKQCAVVERHKSIVKSMSGPQPRLPVGEPWKARMGHVTFGSLLGTYGEVCKNCWTEA